MIFKGDDWKGSPRAPGSRPTWAELGVEVVYFPYTLHTSSTLLRAYITRPEAV